MEQNAVNSVRGEGGSPTTVYNEKRYRHTELTKSGLVRYSCRAQPCIP